MNPRLQQLRHRKALWRARRLYAIWTAGVEGERPLGTNQFKFSRDPMVRFQQLSAQASAAE